MIVLGFVVLPFVTCGLIVWSWCRAAAQSDEALERERNR